MRFCHYSKFPLAKHTKNIPLFISDNVIVIHYRVQTNISYITGYKTGYAIIMTKLDIQSIIDSRHCHYDRL